jgi:hypothetical protein
VAAAGTLTGGYFQISSLKLGNRAGWWNSQFLVDHF